MLAETIQRQSMLFLLRFLAWLVANQHLYSSLVFVHGLGGHPQKTWSTEPRDPKALAEHERPSRKPGAKFLRGLLPRYGSSKSREKSTGGSSAEQLLPNRDAAGNDGSSSTISESPICREVFWPQDLLPKDVEDVRVMTFGYHSDPGGSSQDNLYTLSKSLLGKVANERASAVSRPG